MLGERIQVPPFHRKFAPQGTDAKRYPTYSGGTVRAARPFKNKDAQGRVGRERT